MSKTFQFQTFQFIQTVLIQFSISTYFVYTQLNIQKVLYITIQFTVSRVSMSKTVLFQTTQFSISTQFKCKCSLNVSTVSMSKTRLFQAIQFFGQF